MAFKEKRKEIQEILKSAKLKKDSKEHLSTLIEDLIFKEGCVKYRLSRVLYMKEKLERLAKERAIKNDKGLRDKNKNILFKKKEDFKDRIDKAIKLKKDYISHTFQVQIIEEVNSNPLFYEFEALLSDIMSFVDYSIRITKVFYEYINTKKKKFLDSFKKDDSDIKFYDIFKKHFDGWIIELMKYRDHIVHLSSLNSHFKAVVEQNSGSQKVKKTKKGISISITESWREPRVEPIYLPLEPDYRHKILAKLEDKEIKYEEDFYTFEEYINKIQSYFIEFSKVLTDEIFLKLEK